MPRSQAAVSKATGSGLSFLKLQITQVALRGLITKMGEVWGMKIEI